MVIHAATNVSDGIMHGQVRSGSWCFRYILAHYCSFFLYVAHGPIGLFTNKIS